MSIETARLFIHPFPALDGDAIVKFWSDLYQDPRVTAGWNSDPSPASKWGPDRLATWRDKLAARFPRHGYGAHPVELKPGEMASSPSPDLLDALPSGPNGGRIVGVMELRTLTLAEFPVSLGDKTVTPDDVELAYFYHPASWGRGIASEAAVALVEWAMEGKDGPRLAMVSGSCVDGNQASKKVMIKAGLLPVEGSLGFNDDSEVYFRRVRKTVVA
ncbi:hypothetical protein HKX48_009266 [Thoreauomyces humboldtii]|nr:hypothetical protein HKX48_009266 [Thoreauomyces humboldtii]